MKAICILFITTTIICAQYSPNSKRNKDLDLFMLRISHRYSVPLPYSFYSRPMHMGEIKSFLVRVDSLDHEGVLSDQESFTLNQILKVYIDHRTIFSWKKEEWDTENYANLQLEGIVKNGNSYGFRVSFTDQEKINYYKDMFYYILKSEGIKVKKTFAAYDMESYKK